MRIEWPQVNMQDDYAHLLLTILSDSHEHQDSRSSLTYLRLPNRAALGACSDTVARLGSKGGFHYPSIKCLEMASHIADLPHASPPRTTPLFLCLTFELRDAIYRYVLVPSSGHRMIELNPEYSGSISTGTNLSLLAVNRQINSEATPIFYEGAGVIINVPNGDRTKYYFRLDQSVNNRIVWDAWRFIPPHIFSQLRKIEVRVQLRETYAAGMNFENALRTVYGLLQKVEDIALLKSEKDEPESRKRLPQSSVTLAFEYQFRYCFSMSDTQAKLKVEFTRLFDDSPLLCLLRRIHRTRQVMTKGTIFSDDRVKELLDDHVRSPHLETEDS